MLIRPGQFSTRDLSQRYNKTYCVLHVGGQQRIVKIQSINDDGIAFVNKDGTWQLTHDYMNNADNNVFIELLPVNRGWVCTPDGVYHQRRIPAHQFSRGICDENCSIVDAKMAMKPLTYTLISQMYQEQSVPPVKSLQWYREGKHLGCILSTAFAFSRLGMLWCHRTQIGTIAELSDGETVLMIAEPASLFCQELTDIIRRNQLSNLTVRVTA